MTLSFTPVIGLEIHVQLGTKSKIFCPCSTDYIGAVPNTNVCPVCLGLPGALPVLNGAVVEMAVRTALALRCTIRGTTRFHRKNYFYPDLPKAYQISQYDLPVAENGLLDIRDASGKTKTVRIKRLHLEEDAGKLVHSASDGRLAGAMESFVDYNRGGVPLAEVVSEPDLATPEEARAYVTRLRQIVRYLGVSDGDMEKGSLRVDANVSVKVSDGRWGNRTEIKNLNSLRAIERALEFEIERQSGLLAAGETIVQETRHWNDAEGITLGMRGKEEAHDYRYFPDPDLPPLVVDEGMVASWRGTLPELPWEKEERYVREYGLSPDDIAVLCEHRAIAAYFEDVAREGASSLRAANWVRTEVLRYLNETSCGIGDFPVGAKSLATLLKHVDAGELSTTAARTVFSHILEHGVSVGAALSACNIALGGASGDILAAVIGKVLDENADVVEIIRSGNDANGKKRKFLQGLVMKEVRGQADPAQVSSELARALE
jgi:aspartyl-tRNA(Asn)/glutamyl-tRNA(Gln) amidotransferase subunit B